MNDSKTIRETASGLLASGFIDRQVKVILDTETLSKAEISYLLEYIKRIQIILLSKKRGRLSQAELKRNILKYIGYPYSNGGLSLLNWDELLAIHNFIGNLPPELIN